MEKYKGFLIKGGCLLLALVLAYLFFRFALGIILPFAIALFVVALARPLTNKICEKRKISRSFASVFVVSLLLVVIICLGTICVSLIVKELSEIVSSVLNSLDGENNFISKIFKFVEGLKEKFPFLDKILPGIDESIYSLAISFVRSSVEKLSIALTSFLAGFITSLPNFIITVVVILLSLFYFSKDYDKIVKGVIRILPQNAARALPRIKRDVIGVSLKYIKAYMLLLLLTFTEVFIGFLVLRIKSPFILALVVAIVDLLPVLGVATVLVPWGIIELASGNTYLGIGLLILFVICYIVRQLAEPKILSSQMNVHPLLTLFAMYAGLKLAGIAGIIIAPLAVFVAKAIYTSIKKEKTVENPD